MKMVVSSTRSESYKEISKITVPFLLVAAVGFNILALIFASSWARAPFPGTLFYPRFVASDLYSPQWEAYQNGLEAGDILTSIDDVPVNSGQNVYSLLKQKQANARVKLGLEPGLGSSAGLKSLPVTLTSFSLPDFLTLFWLPYGIGVVYLALGLVVYRLRGAERVGQVFAAFCAFAAIHMGGFFDQYTLHYLAPVWVIVLPLTGAGLIHLGLVFPVETRLIRRQPWVRFVPYVLAAALAAALLYSLFFAASPLLYLSLWRWGFGFIGLSVFVFLALVLVSRFSTFSALVRQQTMIIFWGSILSFGPVALWALVHGLGFQAPFFLSIFVAVFTPFILFPVIVTYAALRYHLLDLDVIFSRGAVYSALTLLTTVGYIILVTLLTILLQDFELFRNPIILAIFVLALVVLLGPLREQVQGRVNRLFLRESFDSRQLLQNYGQALITTPLDKDQILELLLKQADETLAPEHSLVFLRNSTLDVYDIQYQHGGQNLTNVEVRFGISDDLARWLTSTNDILHLNPSGASLIPADISREELARLSMLNVTLCVPLVGSKHLLGWLALGPKKTGHPYLSSDMLFLATLASQTTIALENAHLLKQANQRAAELEVMQKIVVDIQAEVEPDQLLTSVVEQATRLLNAEGGMVFLLEPDNETLRVVVSYRLAQDYTGFTLKKGDGAPGQVLVQGRSLVIDNYQNYPGRSPKFDDPRIGGILAVPLRWGGKVGGVLFLVHRPHGLRFKPDDVWLMELFATQAAIALEKSRLLQEAQRRARQLTTLSEVSVAISSTLDLETALNRVMDRAVQILNTEAGSLLLMDPHRKELTFEVVKGPSGENLLKAKTPIGKGIVGTVAQTGAPLIVNNAPGDPRWNTAFDKELDFKTRDILCVPMITHDLVVGVIEVINKQDGSTFNDEDCSLLLSFGAQAAIAIENAQLFTRTDQALAERIQELQTLQIFDRELQTSLELEPVLDISLTRAMDALGVSMGLMGAIKGVDEERGLYLLAQHGMPMEMGRYKRDPWPLTKGILGRVARTGEIAWINDITQDKDYVPKSHRTRSLLIVPVMREDRCVGVIDLESTDSDYFTSDDVTFVSRLTNHAAIAIENAQLFDQVKEANQAKTEFMRIASHELKIPMTSIKGYSKLLEMGAVGALNEQQRDFLGVISSNVDRMTGLVNDLLDVSRIEAGRIRLEIQDVQMQDVINDVIESVQNQIKTKKLNLQVEIVKDLPELRADFNRMVQIVTNLVSNAYKYTPEGGSIMVMAGPYNGAEEPGIAVTVKDTGYGISKEDQAKLFTNFFRSSDQHIRDEPGTGLGLSITKKMIETHGGELTFESEYGRGSSFTFTLPLICKIPPGVEVVER